MTAGPNRTSSFGVSLSRPPDGDPHGALRAADEAMYRAKETGRNTYAVAGFDRID